MHQPKVEVVPFLMGNLLHIAVTVDGVEFNFESHLPTIFKITAECLDPYNQEHENEGYSLIFAMEEGIRAINDRLGADEQEFANE
jgi:hypothetical protein